MRKFFKFNKSKPAYTAFAILFGLLVASGVYFYQSRQAEPLQLDGVHASIETADQLAKEQQYDQAIAELNRFIGQTKDSEEKNQAKNRLAEIYAAKGDYNRAFDSYRALEELEETATLATLLGVASSADAIGDHKLSLEYYNRAKSILEKSDPENKNEVLEQINEAINDLDNNQGGRSGIYAADVFIRRGEIAENIGDQESATDYYIKALQLIGEELLAHIEDPERPVGQLEALAKELQEKSGISQNAE